MYCFKYVYIYVVDPACHPIVTQLILLRRTFTTLNPYFVQHHPLLHTQYNNMGLLNPANYSGDSMVDSFIYEVDSPFDDDPNPPLGRTWDDRYSMGAEMPSHMKYYSVSKDGTAPTLFQSEKPTLVQQKRLTWKEYLLEKPNYPQAQEYLNALPSA